MSQTPNWGTNSRLAWATLGVTVIVAAALAATYHNIGASLGDTDDAMRLVMVRQLRHGGGWYDQLVTRLQPPLGVYMHWSRLLDGALAGLISLLARVVSPASAEWAVRFYWPLLLIAPAVGCGLLIARRLGGQAAVLVGAVLMLANMELYSQFRPGRIDHHNLQIVMTLVATACALMRDHRSRFAIGAGLATGFGLAIGLEALPYLALIGVNYAVTAAFERREAASARTYALALVASSIAFFMLQTPPGRWPLSVCDALGLNMVAAVMVGGLGLAAVSTWTLGRSQIFRLCLTGLIGMAALAAYLGLNPACLHGPFGSVDPRLRPFWFDSIQELAPWPRLMLADPRDGLRSIVIGVVAMSAAAWLTIRSVRARDWSAALPVALTTAAVLASASAYRAEDCSLWIGIPVLAAVLADFAGRVWRNAMVPTVLTALVASPVCIALAASLALSEGGVSRANGAPVIDHCHDTAAYRLLSRLPPGIVLSEIDLGSFILANTPDSAVAAPYHRMSWGILAAHTALWATPARAQPLVRQLKVAYVVSCPADIGDAPAASLEAQLAHGQPPDWLLLMSPPSATLRVYRVATAPFGPPVQQSLAHSAGGSPRSMGRQGG